MKYPLPATLIAASLLSACTGLPPAPEMRLPPSPLSSAASAQGAQSPSAQRTLDTAQSEAEQERKAQQVRTWLAEPLNAERAVDVALLNNATLQARLSDLNIGLADLEQARRLPNPGFSFLRTRTDEGLDIERGLHLNLARIIFYPQLRGIEAKRFEQTRQAVLHDALNIANRTRRAFYEAVAARQKRYYAEQVKDTADAAGELAKRLEQTGNYNPLSRAREQAFALDAQQALTRARQQESSTRIRLARLMGLGPSDAALRLPDELPPLPSKLRDADEIRRIGINQRLDVQAARQDALVSADVLGLTKASRFITVAELGGLRETGPGGEIKRGVEVSLQLPLFDSGDARVARAEAVYQRSLARVRAAVIEADGDVQLALDAWSTHFELARRQRDETIPLRKRITDETLLRYNGMIGSVFELLAESRAQIASVAAYIDLLKDFWQADSDLNMALLGRPVISLGTAIVAGGQTPEAAAASAGAGGGHPGGH